MSDQTTIEGIYEALNPLPALLSAKGKVTPEATLLVKANAQLSILLSWQRPYAEHQWQTDSQCFHGDNIQKLIADAIAFVSSLPSAEQAKMHRFMGQLGKLIDAGRDEGIAVDFMNPLVDTMKRLSENVIIYQPEPTDA